MVKTGSRMIQYLIDKWNEYRQEKERLNLYAETLGTKRKKYFWIFKETNKALRKRLLNYFNCLRYKGTKKWNQYKSLKV